MTVLRSSKVLPAKPLPKPPTKRSTPEPVFLTRFSELSLSPSSESPKSVPAPEPPARRRSLRLASKSPAEDDPNQNLIPNGTWKRRRKNVVETEDNVVDESITGEVDGDCKERKVVGLSLRSGRGVVKRKMEWNGVDGNGVKKAAAMGGSEDEKKAVIEGESEGEEKVVTEGEDRGEEKEQIGEERVGEGRRTSERSYSRDDKGKGKMYVEDGNHRVEVRSGTENSNKKVIESRMNQFHNVARQNAARFAHFELEEEREEADLLGGVDAVIPAVEEEEVEDWPGPFSTAMKIIKDRLNKLNSQFGSTSNEGKAKPVPIVWVPRIKKGCDDIKRVVPSLQELSMRILAKNADAITSLEVVPDVLRHKLCQLLCDTKGMSSHFLELLFRGSPAEIRIRDCSWVLEEDLAKCFEGCNTSNLTVLQLDQCGRCMADYVLLATLAQSSGSLPMLTTLSLTGAYRLSDVGLCSLVSSAPALKSINLSQCSLLTSTSIDTLEESLGSMLQELYIDECQSIDAMLILPALKKLEYLEVLSLSGIETVCDDFMKEFIVARGSNLKELVLTNCVKLTDSSLKVIADTCSKLLVLNLGNLRKLTDSSLGYLANGCREIHTLKLRGNAFSDEAIAAFVETSGERLKELSLNNVRQVGHNTALSVAKRSRKLASLDLSWCRSLTDEAVGLIVDSCSSLRELKLFGCTQITRAFLDGHSNPGVHIIGLTISHLSAQGFPSCYSSLVCAQRIV